MNDKHVDITFILDKSGSMESVTNDTIGGFNSFIEEQQKSKKDNQITFTLYQFSNTPSKIIDAKDIKEVEKLTTENYIANGISTSLLDAVGLAINETGKRLDKINDQDKPAKVIIVIQTDGEENSSKEFNFSKIKEMITHQETKYNWKFVFLGAGIDAAKQSSMMGIHTNNSMQYCNSVAGNKIMYRSMSKGIRGILESDMAYYSTSSVFTDDVKKEVEETK